MEDLLRTLLMVLLGGVALTIVGAGLAWWFEEERRLNRLIRRALGGEADAAIVARGRGAAAGFSLASNQMVVMAGGGASALLYRLDQVDGAELIIDHVVVARVFRGETRRPLDRIEKAPEAVSLRLIFNDARNPDFDLDLWLAEDAERRHAGKPADAIHEARSWLARIDAILRRAPVQRIATPEPPPWDEEDVDS
jgi:hypothetical protein